MRTEFNLRTKLDAAKRAAGHCEQCTRLLIAGDYNYDHEIPDALGGMATLENCRVLCKSCHAVKTATIDAKRISKAKRNYRKAHGIRAKSKFSCSRDSAFKKKITGEVVRR